MTGNIREIRPAGPIDDDAAALAAHFRELARRAEAGEVIGIFAILVTDDPEADDVVEGVEELVEGIVYTEEKVIVALGVLRDDMVEDWRDANMG